MGGIRTGLDRIRDEAGARAPIEGDIALLTHAAAVSGDLRGSAEVLAGLLGGRLKALFGPQHGFVCDVQDNMVETEDFVHPRLGIPVHSLYGSVRAPAAESLRGIDTLVVDLQDVGTRVYTYVSTTVLALRRCAELGVRMVVLDRPNPVGGEVVEGPVLEDAFRSFVGVLRAPQRHALTIGEAALLAKEDEGLDADLAVVGMDGWRRGMLWRDTGRPWINPSPNLPTPESAVTFCGTVLFEGTTLSEGRGTTRPLETVGHPAVADPDGLAGRLAPGLAEAGLAGECALRPVSFLPMFGKHAGTACGGVHVHPLSRGFRSWRLGQFLLRSLAEELGPAFSWSEGPYEYERDRMPIDLINGGEALRHWARGRGAMGDLDGLGSAGRREFLDRREGVLLYPS